MIKSENLTSSTIPYLNTVSIESPFNRYIGEPQVPPKPVSGNMLPEERQFLFNLARDYYSGAGRIVVSGGLLGLSARCLGAGFVATSRKKSKAGRWEKPIISVGSAVAKNTDGSSKPAKSKDSASAKSSSIEVLDEKFERVRQVIELCTKESEVHEALSDDQIELLVLRGLSTQATSVQSVSEYFPRLIPNRSLVIQQDYFTDSSPDAKVHQEFLASNFSYVGEIGATAIFLCTNQISATDIEPLSNDQLSHAESVRLISGALQRSGDPVRRLLVSLSKLKLIRRFSGLALARQYLEFVEQDFHLLLQNPTLIYAQAAVVKAQEALGLRLAEQALASERI